LFTLKLKIKFYEKQNRRRRKRLRNSSLVVFDCAWELGINNQKHILLTNFGAFQPAS